MPYSQLHRTAKEKLESSTHQRTTYCLADLGSVDKSDTDFSELVWENGQILMQGQSNKARKSSQIANSGVLHQEKEEEHVLPTLKTAHSVLNDFSSSGPPSRHMGLGQDDELAHWLNYPIDDYSSEIFSDFTQNAFATAAVPVIKNISYGGANSEQGNVPRLARETRVTQSHRSRVVTDSSADCNSNQNQSSTIEPTRPPTQPTNNTGLMNFSHFLRPASFGKTNRQSSVDAAPGSSSMRSIDRVRTNDIQSTVIESVNGSSKPNSMAAKVDAQAKPSMGKPPKEPGCREDSIGKTKSPDQASSFAASTAVGGTDNEKCVEPVMASSSVCSGNSARVASNNLKHRFKRKSRDTEESDYPSEDVEEESVGVRKPATARGGTSVKRSRAAEVHNLSERKRRDRINEKMRALQELIPNCNKVDKASMLDEAIEYLKTLQIQVQIMSMGNGLFMPPMMLPNGMQHLPPFSPMNAAMGMGMGMGMGFGMGMLDMSGASSACPLIPRAQFPYPPISGPSSLPIGSNLHMFGPPSQGIPMSMAMSRAPFAPLSGGSSTPPVPRVVATGSDVPKVTVPSSSKEPTLNVNAQLPDRNAEHSQNRIPPQTD